ncbi:hypothetical protein [Methanobrevibacter arboriphilus]|nr:hypothetical protein [Methanobrevibacter arboriphilus]
MILFIFINGLILLGYVLIVRGLMFRIVPSLSLVKNIIDNLKVIIMSIV